MQQFFLNLDFNILSGFFLLSLVLYGLAFYFFIPLLNFKSNDKFKKDVKRIIAIGVLMYCSIFISISPGSFAETKLSSHLSVKQNFIYYKDNNDKLQKIDKSDARTWNEYIAIAENDPKASEYKHNLINNAWSVWSWIYLTLALISWIVFICYINLKNIEGLIVSIPGIFLPLVLTFAIKDPSLFIPDNIEFIRFFIAFFAMSCFINFITHHRKIATN